MKNKKKKGFTLIELIAVIAILGILGAVLVPNIMNYINRAKKSNIQTSAKTIMHAIEVYNSDAATPIVFTAGTNIGAAITTVNNSTDPDAIPTANLPASLTGTDISHLQDLVDGNFKVTGGSGTSITFTIGT